MRGVVRNTLGRAVDEDLGAALKGGRGKGGVYHLKVDELSVLFYTELEV